MTGIGPLAVLKGVKALVLAADYLKDTHTLTAVPLFVDIKVGSSERTAVRLEITATAIPGAVAAAAPPAKATAAAAQAK